MQDLGSINSILHERRAYIARQFAVKRIGVFGSFVHGVQRSDSDIDILVEYEPSGVSFDNYMDLKFYLEDMLGIHVDLVIADDVRDEIREEILADVQYV
ncbi:MAG: nucleotidyltransferase family protein [Spirochaetota bacterium]